MYGYIEVITPTVYMEDIAWENFKGFSSSLYRY